MNAKELEAKKIDRLILKLKSDREVEVTEALLQLREITAPKAIAPIAKLVGHKNERVSQQARNFLLDLKKEEAAPAVIQAIKKEKNIEGRNFLISLFWNTPLRADDNLVFLIELLENGDYMTKVEVMTVIENMQGPFSEQEKEEAIFSLHENMIDDMEKDERMLFHQIERLIRELPTEEF